MKIALLVALLASLPKDRLRLRQSRSLHRHSSRSKLIGPRPRPMRKTGQRPVFGIAAPMESVHGTLRRKPR
jgi:hypothetical protein